MLFDDAHQPVLVHRPTVRALGVLFGVAHRGAETETLLWRHKLRVEFLYWKCYFGPSIDTKLEMDLCDNDGNYWGRIIDGDMRRIRKRKQSFVSNWNCSIISKDFVD